MEEFKVRTTKKHEVVDITSLVSECVRELADCPPEAICLVYVPHATAGVIINEHEPNIAQDFASFFEKLVPTAGTWLHNSIDDNAEAHLKSGLIGASVVLPVSEKRLILGRWQRVMLCEFDGPRERNVIVMVR